MPAPPQLRLPPLSGELGRVCGDIQRWADQLQRAVQYRLRPTEPRYETCMAQPWDLVICDTAGGTFDVLLPASTPENAGVRISVQVYGTSDVTVRAANGDTVCGTTDVAVGAVYTFTSNGRGDWGSDLVT